MHPMLKYGNEIVYFLVIKIMKFSHLEFKEVKGIGSIEVDFTSDKRVHAFIGENGVGKTKFLEALFQAILSIHKDVGNFFEKQLEDNELIDKHNISSLFNNVLDRYLGQDRNDLYCLMSLASSALTIKSNKEFKKHTQPVVFIAAQSRGFIESTPQINFTATGNFHQRKNHYIESLFSGMNNNFSSLSMSIDIEEWFVSIAQSSNPFQKKQDNREIEIRTVLKLCHQIDKNIDSEFMEIGGNNRVFLKINDQKTQLSHLSTGYASILKIIQSIISGYGYFTNEQQLQHVRGIVLIDEIESHLHLSWQSKIIPTLKELFPNTTFYITTHSPVVLTQLENGEAYRLQREEDGVVRSVLIKHPSNSAFVDMLDDAFGLDVNEIKLQRVSSDGQKKAKQRLLDFANKQREAAGK